MCIRPAVGNACLRHKRHCQRKDGRSSSLHHPGDHRNRVISKMCLGFKDQFIMHLKQHPGVNAGILHRCW